MYAGSTKKTDTGTIWSRFPESVMGGWFLYLRGYHNILYLLCQHGGARVWCHLKQSTPAKKLCHYSVQRRLLGSNLGDVCRLLFTLSPVCHVILLFTATCNRTWLCAWECRTYAGYSCCSSYLDAGAYKPHSVCILMNIYGINLV